MDLHILWFILITVLFCGYFFLEGFDYGVGTLLPFLGRNDAERRTILGTIGPFWDGNEVWLLTAGGAIFAAFPNWYATMFSGFYMALVLMLLALIVRGAGIEYRNKSDNPTWRRTWDWLIFAGSAIPALLWGVALSNLLLGVPIDAHMNYVGGFWNLLNPFALVGGLTSLAAFTLHGALFIALKTEGEIQDRANKIARFFFYPTAAFVAIFVASGYFVTDMFTKLGVNPGVAPVLAGMALLGVGYYVYEKKHGVAFALMGASIVFSTITVFLGLFPRVIVSSISPDYSLTIYNASSSDYTLTVMSIIAFTMVPIVLAYQAWNYWIFRQRVTVRKEVAH